MDMFNLYDIDESGFFYELDNNKIEAQTEDKTITESSTENKAASPFPNVSFI